MELHAHGNAVRKRWLGILLLTSLSAQAATPLTVTQAVLAACPDRWQAFDTLIDPGDVPADFWGSTADRNAFLDYRQRYLFDVTTTSTSPSVLAGDALTVASECALRRNKAVDQHFSKTIDTTVWGKRLNLSPILQMLLLHDDAS